MRTPAWMVLLGLTLWSGSASADPLELAALRVRSGFEKAEILDYTTEQAEWGKATARSWAVRSEAGVWSRVVEVVPARPPKNLSGFVGRWLANHGCTAKEVKDVPPLVRAGEKVPPPQLTFGGSCKGGDRYLTRVVLLDGRGYEFHVDTGVMRGPEDLRPELLALLERVELKARVPGPGGAKGGVDGGAPARTP